MQNDGCRSPQTPNTVRQTQESLDGKGRRAQQQENAHQSNKQSSSHAISSDPPDHDEIGSRITAFSKCSKPCSKTSTGRKAQATLSRNLRQPREKSREAKRLEANLRDPIAQYHAHAVL
ncbi:hypothetical protein NW759_000024 [Fusarium solani]|nr:hypothetical protein NW759_000024 [Fusarium solani]